MGSINALEATAGLALVFFLPGFAVARATFPEWRFRGSEGPVRVIETLTLSLLGSVALTILLGFVLLNSTVGFEATWTDPVLFAALAAVTVVGLAVAAARGAFFKVAPEGPALEPEHGLAGSFEAIRELDRLRAEERRLRHRTRQLARDDPERARLMAQIADLETRASEVVARREAEMNAS